MYHFDSDYMEGAHPAILERLTAINFDKHDGYGCDSICDSARARIREACGAPGAEVHLLTGGTQTNATMIKALLRPFEGAVAADTGHINIHEAGAVEATGHKVLPLPHTDDKLCAETVARYIDDFRADGNRDHMVWPGMVYISQPTEYGTLYTLYELEALSRVCRSRSIPLYMDGARLGYALAAPACDMTLRDVARLCDIFYIGGTKCGALLGEAVVIPRAGLIPHLFTTIKQQGALLAKGWVLGVQFDTLFTDGLYLDIAREASTRPHVWPTASRQRVSARHSNPSPTRYSCGSTPKASRLSPPLPHSARGRSSPTARRSYVWPPAGPRRWRR